MNETIVEIDLDKLLKESISENKCLMLYNDDVNTFENVINSLMDYCGHSMVQAEQCANIVHYNGKCDVKHGNIDTLVPIYNALLDRKLTVKIE